MSSNPDSGFPSTDWDLVDDAASESTVGERLSLAALLQRYLPAMREYLRRTRRVPQDQIDDLLQGFVTDKVIGAALLSHADRTRGRFRSLLVRSLEHYLIDQRRSASSSLRAPAGERSVVSLDVGSAGDAVASEKGDPARAFDLAWAESVMTEALRRGAARCAQTGRSAIWDLFVARTFDTDETGKLIAYDQLIARFGFATPSQATNALVTGKRIFRRMLNETLRESAGGGPDVNVAEELADLLKILAESSAGN